MNSQFSTYQCAVDSGMTLLSSGSVSSIAPGCWTLHNIPPPAETSGWSLRLMGPGRKKKFIGSPSTVMKRTGEKAGWATTCLLDGISPAGRDSITASTINELHGCDECEILDKQQLTFSVYFSFRGFFVAVVINFLFCQEEKKSDYYKMIC